jgi:hypothetical protein
MNVSTAEVVYTNEHVAFGNLKQLKKVAIYHL